MLPFLKKNWMDDMPDDNGPEGDDAKSAEETADKLAFGHRKAAEIFAVFQAYVERSERFDEVREEETQLHPNKWVPILNDGCVCVGDSLREVSAEIKRRGFEASERNGEFLSTEPSWIF